MNIEEIRARVRANEYDLSQHAHLERQAEQFLIEEIEKAILSGDVIETYGKDPRGESVLIAGEAGNRFLHVVCGQRGDRMLVITVYEPKLPKWLDYKTRAKELKSRV